jgi:hypothetical protein
VATRYDWDDGMVDDGIAWEQGTFFILKAEDWPAKEA